MAPIGRPREIVDVRPMDVGDAMLIRPVAESKPDFPGAGTIADKRNSSVRRVRGIAIACGGGNQTFRRLPSRRRNAVDIHVLGLVHPGKSPGFPGDGWLDGIGCSLNDTFRRAPAVQRKSPEPKNAGAALA